MSRASGQLSQTRWTPWKVTAVKHDESAAHADNAVKRNHDSGDSGSHYPYNHEPMR